VKITLRVWRQDGPEKNGRMVKYRMDEVDPDMSFLEMLDVLNEQLAGHGEEPIAFDHDCREGICGACGMVINGSPHGPQRATTTCQLHMRHFKDGDTVDVEPWRAEAFPVVRDLVVDRGALDRVVRAGGYISAPTGSAPEAHATPVAKQDADHAFESAACIGCGACVAACPNASAMLFTAAKVSHLGSLPQGRPEHNTRVLDMVETMEGEGFGGCTNVGACATACPKGIPVDVITALNRDWLKAVVKGG
jgi:succinate dehydrogenase / fumarate reductase iron-sulfur subunit